MGKKSHTAKQPQVDIGLVENIPLNTLVISPANVRTIRADDDASITAMAESISRRGLLQSIMVRPELDAEGNHTGRYEVPGGGRRLRALQKLVMQKRLAADAPIPCIMKTAGLAELDSLAENNDREELHPLDQFRAFAKLRDKGQGDEQIAAAFGVTPAVVRQRLRLATASNVLLDAYASDNLTLDQLMAFCLTTDHARQEQVYEAMESNSHGLNTWQIKRYITEGAVAADDRRVLFVGIDAYVAAGGPLLRDLFDEDDGGWLQEPTLLNKLVQDKLDGMRKELLERGWKWVHAAVEVSHGARQGLRAIDPIGEPLGQSELEEQSALREQLDALTDGDEDDLDSDARTELARIREALRSFDNREPPFDPEEKAIAGVFLTIDHDGHPYMDFGYVRPEDEISRSEDVEATSVEPSAITDPTEEAGTGDKLSERLVQELTAYKTMGMRHALAQDPETAGLALLHALCLGVFYLCDHTAPLQIKTSTNFPADAAGLDDWPATKATVERHRHWKQQLPKSANDLWAFLLSLKDADRAMLQAHCVGMSLNVVQQPFARKREATLFADQIGFSMGFDMAKAGWTPTVDTYLGRVTKILIIQAVSEAKGENAAELISSLKKPDMAKEAERLLSGTGWLPQVLRSKPSITDQEQDEPTVLPDFLDDEHDEQSAA